MTEDWVLIRPAGGVVGFLLIAAKKVDAAVNDIFMLTENSNVRVKAPVYVKAPVVPLIVKSTSELELGAIATARQTFATNEGSVFAVQYQLARGSGVINRPLMVVFTAVLPIDTAVALVVPNERVAVESTAPDTYTFLNGTEVVPRSHTALDG